MGTRTRYGPGAFCWANLSTPDPDEAKRFYARLFGWDYDDRTGDGFWMARRHDANVAAIYPREQEEKARGLPPHWNNYINVDDADEAAERAVELGGSVFEEAFDVSDAGRTAVLLDPAGAMFWVWQPRAHIGAGRVNDPGCLAWNELETVDPEGATAFYQALFGWTFRRDDAAGEDPSWVIGTSAAAAGINGAMRTRTREDATAGVSLWIPYFSVETLGAACDIVLGSGGRIDRRAGRSGGGGAARGADPAGAGFGLYQGPVDD